MTRLADRILQMFNLRILVAVIALWLCMSLPQPRWLQSTTEAVDHALFRLAMDFSALPSSQSHITVVHLSPVEYASWLADIPGAQRLEHLLDQALKQERTQTVVGLVLEQPLSMIQSQAESLLTDVQQGRRTHDHLFTEINEMLSRRDRLVATLQGPQVILGVENALFSGGEVVQVGDTTPWAAKVPAWLQSWLWQPSFNKTAIHTANPVFSYAPIWSQSKLARSLITQADKQTLPGFELLFLQAAATKSLDKNVGVSQEPESDNLTSTPIIWRRASGFGIGDKVYRASVFGDSIPLYGGHSSLRSALRQLSLDAALDSESLSEWILVGRDGSETLEFLAQSIAAMADGAQIIEPLWWSPLQKLLLVLLALMLCFLAPLMSRYWKITSVLLVSFTLILSALLAQSIYGYWLSVADPLVFLFVGLMLISIWQHQILRLQQVQSRIHGATLRLVDQLVESGDLVQAVRTLNGCEPNKDVLPRLYRLGESLAEQNQPLVAMEAFSAIYKRKRRFKDVPQKIQQLEQQLQTQQLLERQDVTALPGALDKTQNLSNTEQKTPMLGRYEIKSELGRGANGTVFLGYDPKIAREVAIKTLHYQKHDQLELESIKARFFIEARAVGRLAHPNIVQVYDVGEEDNLAYMTMDYARGRPLSDFIHADTLLPIVDVYKIALVVAEALQYAHQQDVIHRDIKPSNIIFLAEPFSVRVTDFGIARLTDYSQTTTGEVLGSPLYMAPEQLRGDKATSAVDVFSLGVTFYQLLTGQLPFNGDNIANLSYSIINAKHQSVRQLRKELPTSATRISNMALQKKPEHRFRNAGDFADALRKSLKRDFGVEMFAQTR